MKSIPMWVRDRFKKNPFLAVIAFCAWVNLLTFIVSTGTWLPLLVSFALVLVCIGLVKFGSQIRRLGRSVRSIGSVLVFLMAVVSTALPIGQEIRYRRDLVAVAAAVSIINSASLADLRSHFDTRSASVLRPAAIEKLGEALNDQFRPWQQRGNAAIGLALAGFCDRAKNALTYEDDPSVRSWFLGAVPLWANADALPHLLAWVDSEEPQIRSGAIAALGIAGPEVYSDEASETIIRKLTALQNDVLGQVAGLDNVTHWALERYNAESRKDAIPPGERFGYKWYRTPRAGLVMIELPRCLLDGPGEAPAPKAEPYFLSDTEVTVGAFTEFFKATDYQSTAEARGASWSLNDRYEWSERRGANWRNLKIANEIVLVHERLPVAHVSWVDAAHFCNWLSDSHQDPPLDRYYMIDGEKVTRNVGAKGYRLPTMTEWRCAALADTRTSFWWGRHEYLQQPDWRADPLWKGWVGNLPDSELGRSLGTADFMVAEDGFRFTAPVATFRPNPLGFFDIIGNVAEWCAWPDEREGDAKPVMGGSWGDDLKHAGPYYPPRYNGRTDGMLTSHVNVGFRVARSN